MNVKTVSSITKRGQKIVKTVINKTGTQITELFTQAGDIFIPQYKLVRKIGENDIKHYATIFSDGKPKYLLNNIRDVGKRHFGMVNFPPYPVLESENGNWKDIPTLFGYVNGSKKGNVIHNEISFLTSVLEAFKKLPPVFAENKKNLHIIDKMTKSL